MLLFKINDPVEALAMQVFSRLKILLAVLIMSHVFSIDPCSRLADQCGVEKLTAVSPE